MLLIRFIIQIRLSQYTTNSLLAFQLAATQKNYGNATAAPPEPGRNFGPAFGGAHYSKQNKTKL